MTLENQIEKDDILRNLKYLMFNKNKNNAKILFEEFHNNDVDNKAKVIINPSNISDCKSIISKKNIQKVFGSVQNNIIFLYEKSLEDTLLRIKPFDFKILNVKNLEKIKQLSDVEKNRYLTYDIRNNPLVEIEQKKVYNNTFTIKKPKTNFFEQRLTYIQNFGKKPLNNNNADFENIARKPYKCIDFKNLDEDTKKNEVQDIFNLKSQSDNLGNILKEKKKMGISPFTPFKSNNAWLDELTRIDDEEYKKNLKKEVYSYMKEEDKVNKYYII